MCLEGFRFQRTLQGDVGVNATSVHKSEIYCDIFLKACLSR
jgi:hypothetical protein